MTQNYFTPIEPSDPGDAETINSRLEELDEALSSSQLEERGGHVIKGSGSTLVQKPYLNFVGDSVTVEDVGGKTVVTVSNPVISTAHSRLELFAEFLSGSPTSQNPPLSAWSLKSSATVATRDGEANHYGIHRVTSHSSNSNSGAITGTGADSVLLQGNMAAEIIFKCPTLSALVHKLGFTDVSTISDSPTNGVWISVDGDLVQGRTADNGSASLTATGYTISADQWYRAKIVLNSDATQVDFYLYDDDGVELWHDTLTSNIPTATGRECAMQMVAGKTSAGAAAILDVDWVGFYASGLLR
jgi:hypothetical protein